MNTRLKQTSTSAAPPPGTTHVAEREGWLAPKLKWPAPMFLIAVFLGLPLVLLGSAFAVPPAAVPTSVIQTQETSDEGVVGELIECRRSEGVLTIKVRFRNNSDKAVNLTFIHWGAVGVDVPKFYVTAGNKKYFVLKDTDGTVLSSNSANSDASLGPGKTYLWWGKYPAPPAEVKKINFMMPLTAPFEDVPITDK
jgi:hypothetical protein